MTVHEAINLQASCDSGGYRVSDAGIDQHVDLRVVASDSLVSVITVVRNGEHTIKNCIDSVLAQSYENVEHIIIDGGSTDQTVEILRSYGDEIALWISEQDRGIYHALNKGIKLARGRYYIPLGCDDTLISTGVESLILHAKSNLVICGKVQVLSSDKRVNNLTHGHSASALIDVRAHDNLGYYDESYRIAADTKFLQMAERSLYVHKIEDVVGKFSLGGASSMYWCTVNEHARAMREAGSWGRVKSLLWLSPRLIWSTVSQYLTNKDS